MVLVTTTRGAFVERKSSKAATPTVLLRQDRAGGAQPGDYVRYGDNYFILRPSSYGGLELGERADKYGSVHPTQKGFVSRHYGKDYLGGSSFDTEQNAFPVSDTAALAGAVATAKTGSRTGTGSSTGARSTITPGRYQPTQSDVQLAIQKGTLQVSDPGTGRPLTYQPEGFLLGTRTASERQLIQNVEAASLAKSGSANYQDVSGRSYNVSYDNTLNQTLDGLSLITAEGGGETRASFLPSAVERGTTPFGDPFKQSLLVAKERSQTEAAEFFTAGGAYVIPGALSYGGSVSLGIAEGIVGESQNTGAVLRNLVIGGLFGSTERALTIGSRSENVLVRTQSKGILKTLPVVNLALAGGYATERGYHGAQAFEEGRLPEFIGETAVQIGTFGVGYGAGKFIVAPRTLSVSGRPTSDISVLGSGEQRYTGIGQEVNAPFNPQLVTKTSYTEKASGYLGRYGDVRTDIIEFGNTRITRRDIGGSIQQPKYRFVSIVRDISPRTGEGIPKEQVYAYKNGKLFKTYEQTSQGFGKIVVGSRYDAFKFNEGEFRKTPTTSLIREKPIFSQRVTKSFRKIDKPDKSIVGQLAGEERILSFNQPISKDFVIVGKLGTGSRSEAISFTRRAKVEATTTIIERSMNRPTKVIGPRPLLKGTAKVNLDVTESPLRNEFVQSVNRAYSEGPVEVSLNKVGRVIRAKETVGSYSGVVEKPLVETIGAKRVSIAGTLRVVPKNKGRLNMSLSPIKTVSARTGRLVNTPRLLGEDVGISIRKVTASRGAKKIIGTSGKLITTSGDVVNGISLEPARVSSLSSFSPGEFSFSVPIGGVLPSAARPFAVSGTTKQGSFSIPASKPAISSIPRYDLQSLPTSDTSLSSTQLSRSFLSNVSVPISTTRTSQSLVQQATTTTTTTVPTLVGSSPFRSPVVTVPPPTFPSFFPTSTRRSKRKKSVTRSFIPRSFSYTPTAVGLNLPVLRRAPGSFTSGLSIRPIVLPRRGVL